MQLHEPLDGKLTNPGLEGSGKNNLGLSYRNLGDVRKAIERHEQALEIARETGNLLGEASQLGNLGLCYSDLGDVRKAIEHHEQALEIARETGNALGEASELDNLGLCYHCTRQNSEHRIWLINMVFWPCEGIA